MHMLDANSPYNFYSLRSSGKISLAVLCIIIYPIIAVGCDGNSDSEVSLQNLLSAGTQGKKDRTNYRCGSHRWTPAQCLHGEILKYKV